MFKVHPDGSIETSSAEEALELQRLIQEREAKKQRHAKPQPTLFSSANGHEPESEVLKKLLLHRGTEINSAQMAPIIGAKSVAGVGPKLYHLKNRNPQLADILEEQRDDNGVVTWRVR
jgi:hypothetical protein